MRELAGSQSLNIHSTYTRAHTRKEWYLHGAASLMARESGGDGRYGLKAAHYPLTYRKTEMKASREDVAPSSRARKSMIGFY